MKSLFAALVVIATLFGSVIVQTGQTAAFLGLF